ncbi:hypothetical protein HHX47_DHR7000384 [Lentinula edodes]|nr:hypothetical protein HHX47_DHR7000384 [Lentinula edodes]
MSNPTSAPTTTTSNIHGKLLLREPSIFDGDKAQFKEWRRTLFAYIRDPRNRIVTDSERIDIAVSYMRGPKVSSWVQNYTDDNFNDDEEEWKVTWKGFKDALNASFLDKGLTENAQEKLEHLRQGPNERAEDFFKEFEVIMRDAGYAKDAPYVIRLIEMNVKPKLIDQVYGTSNERIEKFDELKQKIISIDDMWWRREEMRRNWSSRYQRNAGQGPSSQRWQPQTTQAPATKAPTPAVPTQDRKDGTGTTFKGAGRPMDIDAARRNKECFHCGKQGHIAKFCPEKAPKPQFVRGMWSRMTQEDQETMAKELGFVLPQQ